MMKSLAMMMLIAMVLSIPIGPQDSAAIPPDLSCVTATAAYTVAQTNYDACASNLVVLAAGGCDYFAMEVTQAWQVAMAACSFEQG